MAQLQPGDDAPDFEALTDQNQRMHLRDFRGKKVILYFYPEDDTSGCTVQACGFRDHHAEVQELNTVVLGVSPDGVASHVQFKAKYGLPFLLLVDADHALARAYHVWQEQPWPGPQTGTLRRSHFVIDEAGKIVAAEYQVAARDSVQHAMQTLRQNF